ncbi:MAG TPA: heparan-alpha-glucosaminide N-acetyltransferase [Methanoregulaceae archaeon]|nr:heparan-alpha-glucosaminide N-acetyltransferase [Methanoregulaceae archaeon]
MKILENTHIDKRFIEIDIARGIAVVMMIVYHLLFDLWFFSLYSIPVTTGFWKYFAGATASLFLLLVGISVTISAAHAENILSRRDFYLKFIRRGIAILLIAAGITLATWWYLGGEGFVIFGILDLIGVSIILAPLFFHRGKKTLVASAIVIIVGLLLVQVRGPAYLIPIGIFPESFYSVDYTPVFPWFGLVLAGIFLGETLYPGGRRVFSVPDFPGKGRLFSLPATILSFLGRHSLIIYIVHQPVIILFLHPPF